MFNNSNFTNFCSSYKVLACCSKSVLGSFCCQSILKEINPEYSLEGWMLKLKYFGHVMQRVNSLAKTLMLGKTEGRRRRG